jgi:hypothetical protein
MEVTKAMSRKIIVLLTVCFIFVTASVFAADVLKGKDAKVNAAAQEVLNGTANQATANTLEAALKKDPKNADLAALLAGAYGIMYEQSNNKQQGDKAKSFAAQALKTNPNSNGAKIASLGVKAYSENSAERNEAIAGLQQLANSAEGARSADMRNFLIGKAHAKNGNNAEAEKSFSASKLAIASKAKSALRRR